MRGLKIFSGRANRPLADRICTFLNLSPGNIALSDFPDGEISCKIEEDVRGRDVFLIQPTCPPVNKNLIELLIMIDSCKRASAARITAVLPYFGYARQDRKDEGRVPITAKLVANLITRAGADRALTMDLHAAQIQGFFDVPVDHLYAAPVLNGFFLDMGLKPDDIVIVSPDEGSIKRAVGHSKRLGGQIAIVDKRRSSPSETRQANIIGGPIDGRVALMFDDMISTAGSICGAARMVDEAGASEVYVAATHGVLAGEAVSRLRDAPIKKIVLTDTIPLTAEQAIPKIETLSVAALLGEAIKRIHHDESISEIFRVAGVTPGK
ncbi:MAG: ribose-phosphate pyrophosphokinase [Planctomycetaceae bacterium]|nr:ribose-phosphate pyrophosphokinase [Planctomycetaceae bacterium]